MSAASGANAASIGAVAAAVAASEAIKACGSVVRVEPMTFLDVLARHEAPLVLAATGGLLWTHHKYVTSYKGLAFYTKSADPLDLPEHCEVMEARKITHPEL